MVLILLTEVVALYMQITIIQVGVPRFKDLLVLSLAFAAGAARTTGAWSRTFLIQVYINSWKKLLGVGAGAGSGPGDGSRPENTGLGAGRLRTGLLQQAGGIAER